MTNSALTTALLDVIASLSNGIVVLTDTTITLHFYDVVSIGSAVDIVELVDSGARVDAESAEHVVAQLADANVKFLDYC